MIIVRKTIGKGFAPEILKKQFPYEIVFGGETKYIGSTKERSGLAIIFSGANI